MNNEIDFRLLREVQNTQLEILIEFDRICSIYNLKYQLFSGTLLGAIRHKGFIPWDDDIDVAMAREDYEKFLEVCNNELKSKYFLQNYQTDVKFFRQYSKLRINNTKYVEKAYESLDIHQGIFIDIFPMDKVMPNTLREFVRCKILLFVWYINRIRNIGCNSNNKFKNILSRVIQLSNKIVKKSTFDRFEYKILTLFNNKETGYFNHMTNKVTKERFNRFLIKEGEFNDTIMYEFEGYKFPIPRNYHKYLTQIYGDYMEFPPAEEQKPHHDIIKIKV